MQPRLFGAISICRALLGLSALCAASCTGTPLPEPPDELPKPDFGSFARDALQPANVPDRPVLQLGAGRGAVRANSRVSIINLDTDDPVVQVTATDLGGFSAPPFPASGDDRVRVLSRTERQHSEPLDLRTFVTDAAYPLLEAALLPDTGLSCFYVTPALTLSLHTSQGTLRLVNECEVSLDLTRAALRFGDQGLALVAAPARLLPGERATLTIDDSRGPGASERLDIVLIDVSATDGRTGRYAIDVFSALE